MVPYLLACFVCPDSMFELPYVPKKLENARLIHHQSAVDLQGRWGLLMIIRDGKWVYPPARRLPLLYQETIEFIGPAFIEKGMPDSPSIVKGPYKIGPAAGELDLIYDGGKGIPCIYQLRGDDLKICLDRSGKTRPNGFNTEHKPRWELRIYRKVKLPTRQLLAN